ncbi:hypothetical protein ACFWIO_39170 [Streptomyces diastatochromogenes]|uniref:hypothetical protein n=1 Tax=Streptomyces diastatochromogenes TaxID=42236 RepID=UPI003661563A
MDGKTVRGARRTDGTQVHLLAAMTGTGMVTAQREVDATTNEITVFQPLLAPLNLHGTVVTFEALHSQTAHARSASRAGERRCPPTPRSPWACWPSRAAECRPDCGSSFSC